MTRRLRSVVLAGLMLGNLLVAVHAQDHVYRFAGLGYQFPAAAGVSGTVLVDVDGAGTLSWLGVGVPAGVVAFSTTGACPTGWSEVTTARGRYVVGLPSGGTAAGTVGTGLANIENRPVGQHGHLVVDAGHNHGQDAHSHSLTDPGHAHTGDPGTTDAERSGPGSTFTIPGAATSTGTITTGLSVNPATATNQSATTGATIANAGTVAGTNAPYVQLLACSKDAE